MLFAQIILACVLASIDASASLSEISVEDARKLGFDISIESRLSTSLQCIVSGVVTAPMSIGDSQFWSIGAGVSKNNSVLFGVGRSPTNPHPSVENSLHIVILGELLHDMSIIATYRTRGISIGIKVLFNDVELTCE